LSILLAAVIQLHSAGLIMHAVVLWPWEMRAEKSNKRWCDWCDTRFKWIIHGLLMIQQLLIAVNKSGVENVLRVDSRDHLQRFLNGTLHHAAVKIRGGAPRALT